MLLCLADDLTGLVEVATQVAGGRVTGEVHVRPPMHLDGYGEGMCFINLGCRDRRDGEARAELTALLGGLAWEDEATRVALKVDSAGRGPLGGMLRGLIEATGRRPMPLLLANPATGRSVRRGKIYIGDRLLAETAFAADPLHPRAESAVSAIVGQGDATLRISCDAGEPLRGDVCVLDAASAEEVRAQARRCGGIGIGAGAAPFVVALLEHWSGAVETGAARAVPGMPMERVLMVVGSRHPATQELIAEFRGAGGQVRGLGKASEPATLPLLIHSGAVEGEPRGITEALAQEVCRAVERLRPEGLFLTGGETALAVLDGLGIQRLRPLRHVESIAELAPCEARAEWPARLWLKPGSYGAPGLVGRLFQAAAAAH